MKIYIVTHYWDNGERYEDYIDYEESSYFSTLKLAAKKYWDCIKDYIGKFALYSVELDTQNKVTLTESRWKHCPSVEELEQMTHEKPLEEMSSNEYGLEDYSYDCDALYYWRYPVLSDVEEEEAVKEWLTHEGETYQILKKIEDDKLFNKFLYFLRDVDSE